VLSQFRWVNCQAWQVSDREQECVLTRLGEEL
jgi:hypothetical protein